MNRKAAGLLMGVSALGAGLVAAATRGPREVVNVTVKRVGALDSTHGFELASRKQVELHVSSHPGPVSVVTLPRDPPGRRVEPGTGRRSVLLASQGATQFQASEVLEPGPWVVVVRAAQGQPPPAEPVTVSLKVSVH